MLFIFFEKVKSLCYTIYRDTGPLIPGKPKSICILPLLLRYLALYAAVTIYTHYTVIKLVQSTEDVRFVHSVYTTVVCEKCIYDYKYTC